MNIMAECIKVTSWLCFSLPSATTLVLHDLEQVLTLNQERKPRRLFHPPPSCRIHCLHSLQYVSSCYMSDSLPITDAHVTRKHPCPTNQVWHMLWSKWIVRLFLCTASRKKYSTLPHSTVNPWQEHRLPPSRPSAFLGLSSPTTASSSRMLLHLSAVHTSPRQHPDLLPTALTHAACLQFCNNVAD